MRQGAAPIIGPILGLACAMGALAGPRPVAPTPAAQALARAARDSRAEAQATEAQIAELRGRLVALGAVEASGEHATGDKKSRLDALNQQEQALAAQLGESQHATARLLGVLALFRRDPPPALLTHPQSAKDAVRAQILAKALEPELQRRSRALAEQLTQLRALRRQVETASEDLFKSESDLADQRAQIEQMIADKSALERSLIADADQADADLRRMAAAAGAPAALIGRLPPEGDPHGPPPARFVEPVVGKLVARYGEAATQRGPKEGFTWAAAAGAPVLAPAGGLIEYAGPLKDYGIVLILKTGGAYDLVLTGLGATQATAGRSVAAGEPVGRMAEDAGTPRDLYLEVRRGGETIDPSRWFKTAIR
jgi:septal ring factor EnvC (AmiA/AmiB activator)